jgi:outer membrane protein
MKKTIVLFSLLASLASIATAQKFGYTNSVALLSRLPEVQQADSDLKAFQTHLTKKGQEMVRDLQEKAAELERKQQLGTISPKDYQAQSAALQAEEDKIGAYEKEVYTKLAEKREELFKPILDLVNQAMQDVAKEGGFTFVFDSSTQVLLYGAESLDLTAQVLAKLGADKQE